MPTTQILCVSPQDQIAVAVTTNPNVPPDSKPKPIPALALSPAWDYLSLTILQNPAEVYLLLEPFPINTVPQLSLSLLLSTFYIYDPDYTIMPMFTILFIVSLKYFSVIYGCH